MFPEVLLFNHMEMKGPLFCVFFLSRENGCSQVHHDTEEEEDKDDKGYIRFPHLSYICHSLINK